MRNSDYLAETVIKKAQEQAKASHDNVCKAYALRRFDGLGTLALIEAKNELERVMKHLNTALNGSGYNQSRGG